MSYVVWAGGLTWAGVGACSISCVIEERDAVKALNLVHHKLLSHSNF